MRRRIFIKQMTPAEAGDTKTHEKYIRLPNNFDYQSFFNKRVLQMEVLFRSILRPCIMGILKI